MNKKLLTLWLTRLAWGLLFFDLLLILVVPDDTSFGNLLLLIAYMIWLVLTLLVASTWLTIHYRAFFRTWVGWAIPLVLLAFSSLVVQGVLSISHLGFFFSMLFVVSFWCIGIATGILLWYRDVGLGLIAGGTILVVWVLLFVWRFQGNLIELFILSLNHPNESSPFWWFGLLACVFDCIAPLSILSFLVHTIRLIVRELQ